MAPTGRRNLPTKGDPSSIGTESITEELEQIPGLIIGDWEVIQPEHPDAQWTGQKLALDVEDDAATDPLCQATGSGATYPCLFFDFAGIGGFVVHGPITIYLLARETGTTMLVAPYWGHEPLPSDAEFAALEEHLAELVVTIRFVD